jgi:hypothetical protein
METVSSSKTSVNFYQTTRRNDPEDSHLLTRHRENLKSHNIFDVSQYVLKLFGSSVETETEYFLGSFERITPETYWHVIFWHYIPVHFAILVI